MSKQEQEREPNFIIKLFRFLTNKVFFKNLLFIGLFLLLLFFGLRIFLSMYTNHGQALPLPDFKGMHIDKASKLASDKTFRIMVDDSTHIVGKPGGIILNQNPKADAKVKENRKVYVTITKYNSDMIRLKSLPELYGRDFAQKKKELAHLKINARIKEYSYDQGEPDHILQVYYKGKLIVDEKGRRKDVRIEKGGTLDMVLSKPSGLAIPIPDLRCQTFAAAQFMLEDGLRLKLGSVNESGTVSNQSTAYVISQYPPYEEGKTILVGDVIDLTIATDKPEDCN